MLSIEDRLGLQDLIANYSWALDTGDAEGLVACFTEDCVMSEEVFEDPDVWEGHEGIRGLMAHYANAPGFPGRPLHVPQTQSTPLRLRHRMRGRAALCAALHRLVRRPRGQRRRWPLAVQAPHRAPVGRRGAQELPGPGPVGSEEAAGVADHQAVMGVTSNGSVHRSSGW